MITDQNYKTAYDDGYRQGMIDAAMASLKSPGKAATEEYYKEKILELELKVKALEAELQFIKAQNFRPFPA